jgi:hypothetical protein
MREFNVEEKTMTTRILCFSVIALMMATAAFPQAAAPDGKEDFAKIARRGFLETIDPSGNFVPNLGSQHNNYTWSGAWFKGKLYIGTNRDVLCGLTPDDPPAYCPAETGLLGSQFLAEIWEYTPLPDSPPSIVGGIRGTWKRVYQSPMTGFGSYQSARDTGYRSMMVSSIGGVERLYIATMGAGGRILYTANGTTFSAASSRGLYNSLTQLANGTADLGFRTMLTWKNRVFIAPTANLNPDTGVLDADIPANPVVFSNSNPASSTSTWQVAVNTKTQPGVGDPDNQGVFTAAVFNDNLYIGVTNRTTGMELWKGSGATCLEPPGACTISWTKLVDNGGGRLVPSDGVADNAGAASMEVFNGALYIGVSDAAAVNRAMTEMWRINADDTWNLIVGNTRTKSAMPANFNCKDDGTGRCVPESGMGAGFGAIVSPPTYADGQSGYVWRLKSHEGYLYAGTLRTGGGQNSSGNGFQLLRSADGVNWTFINQDGFGNPGAYGIRTMLSIPDWPGGPALIVGSANPYTDAEGQNGYYGGNEIYVGTCAASGPPVAVPGPTLASAGPTLTGKQVYFDTAQTGTILGVPLDGTGSYDVFCGSLASYEWYDGNIVASCQSPGVAPFASTATTTRDLATGSDFTDYQFTLRVTDNDGNCNCAPYTVRVSKNRPPTATVATTPPANSSGRLTVVDADNSGSETIPLTGTGTDPEGNPVTYKWTSLSNDGVPNADVTFSDPAIASPSVTILTNTGTSGSSSRRRLTLTVTDDHGYTGTASVQVSVNPPTHDPSLVSIVPATVPGFKDVLQNVTVNVKNEGNVPETFTVHLADPAGTVGPVSSTVTNLAAGGSSGVLFSWTPTGAGSHTLTATIDTVTGETDTADNTLALAVDVVDAPIHDISVVSIAPTTIPGLEGISQNVTVNVKNEGNVSETFSVSLADPSGAVGLVSASSSLTLAGGATGNVIFSWTSTGTGSHTLTATADTVAGETDTADNSKTLEVTVDAVVHDVAVISITPTTTPALETFSQNVTVNVKNEGNVSESFNVALADETAGTIATSPLSVTNLAPGVSQNVIFSWTPTSASLHKLTATADTVSGETDAADNVKSSDVTVDAIVHDASVVLITTAATPRQEGSAQNVTVNVKNEGNVSETFSVSLGDPAGSIRLVSASASVTLAAGAASDVIFSWTPTSGGSHTLTGTATLATDTDTADNEKTLDVAVTAIVHDASVLSVTTAATPRQEGSAQNVTVNVKNEGNVSETFSVSLGDPAG